MHFALKTENQSALTAGCAQHYYTIKQQQKKNINKTKIHD